MTLTTYLAQSVVCTTVFYHWGFGLMGKVSYLGMLAINVVLFSVQVVFSVWWLRRYRFGPAAMAVALPRLLEAPTDAPAERVIREQR